MLDKRSKNIISRMLLSYVSFRETAGSENYYHSFLTEVLGITRGPNRSVEPTPGGENGSTGISVCNYERSTAALLVLKKSSAPISIRKACKEAMEQIQCLQYDFCLRQEGYTRILQYGIDFRDWGCEILLTDPDGDRAKSSPRTLQDLPDHPQDLCSICAIRLRLHD